MLKIPETLNKNTILKYIDEINIFEYYLGYKIEIGKLYISPFLRKGKIENTPSFNIYINKYNGRIWFKDFGSYSGDCFRLIQHLYQDCSFVESLKIVNKDFNLNIGEITNTIIKILPKRELKEKQKFIIQVKIQSFTFIDIEYWKQYDIKEEHLKYFKVFSIKEVWINKFQLLNWSYKNNNPIYGYYFHKKFKLYRPKELNKRKKWKNNLLPEYWLGLDQLPKTYHTLIITKSFKDVMVFRILGFYAVAINGENHSFPSSLLLDLKKRFKNIIIFFDNDEIGIKFAKEKAKLYNLNYIHIPIKYKEKDISDYYKEFRKKETVNLLDNLDIYKYAFIK